ncbi:hypothetical protein, partial [Pseudomonas lundensis]|uniref:hypothetical protein n=1 Tax=Pseudomonas lundensis TaxID=86185 RepID=UPI00147347EB
MEYKLKVVAGHLIFLPDDLSVPFESDIACSQLFMQLYADAQVDRFSDVDKWDQCFSRARSNMKWITTLSHAVNVNSDEYSSFSVISEVSGSLMHAQPNKPGITVGILSAGLKNFADDERAQRVFFESALKRPAAELKGGLRFQVQQSVDSVEPIGCQQLQMIRQHFNREFPAQCLTRSG